MHPFISKKIVFPVLQLASSKRSFMKKILLFATLSALINSCPSQSLTTYSKFDFIPGEKIIIFEDFTQDAIGDFPAKWNTNSSGEIVTADGETGHWLMISKKGKYTPEYITNLPENFTLQFDLLSSEQFNYNSSPLQVIFTTVYGKDVLKESDMIEKKWSAVSIGLLPTNPSLNGASISFQSFQDSEEKDKNEFSTARFNSNPSKAKVKVSVWRQKQRLRVYLDEEKIIDVPRAFEEGKPYKTVMFETWMDMFNDKDRYLLSNIKLAIGSPDTRNKLINEGKFVTRGILFDVNSDKVKAESYGALKDIAGVLLENPSVKVMIVGHTDSDGSDADNLALSKRRAEAVKTVLMKDFKVDASRMTTDGKGESQPVDKNDSPEGKANNRRVEFIRQ